jgi:hypothetical protein
MTTPDRHACTCPHAEDSRPLSALRVRAPRTPARAFAAACALALPVLLAGCWGGGGDAGSASASYPIGGSIAGFSSTGLVLANGTDTLSPAPGATSFVFVTAVPAGGGYAVTVQTQPNGATCSVANGSGNVGVVAVANVQVTCVPITYSVTGSVTGLTTAGLVLANGGDAVAVAAGATGFALPTALAQGASYAVTVQAQPSGEQCSLTHSIGTISGGNVTNVAVACAATSHTLGGTISGLPSAGLVLANGSDTVSPAAGAVSFVFATPVAEGGAYAVSVTTQAAGATCSVGSGSGTMGTGDIASVQVTCAANAYHVGGTIAGLTTAGLVLANGTDTVSPAANATSFAFARTVAYGGTYSVTIQQQPAGQTCAVAGTYPATMGVVDVTDVAVTCGATSTFTLVAGQETCLTFPAVPVDGTGGGAVIPTASELAVDAAGNIFVLNFFNTLQRITPTGVVTTIAGAVNQSVPVDGTGSAAHFKANSDGMAINASGNVVLADGQAIRMSTASGVVSTIAGNLLAAAYVNGNATTARFNEPNGVAIDAAGNIFVADTDNYTVRKISTAGVVSTLTGTPGGGLPGFVDGPPGTAQLAPIGITIDSAGTLYVAESYNKAVRRIAADGTVTTIAGGGPYNAGVVDGTGSAAQFGGPRHIAMGPGGNLYVLDNYGGTQAIRMVTPAGVVTTVAIGSALVGVAGVPQPALHFSNVMPGLATDRSGNLFVAIGCAIEKVGP